MSLTERKNGLKDQSKYKINSTDPISDSNEKAQKIATNFRKLIDNMLNEVHHWKIIYDECGEIKTWVLLEANPTALKSWNKKLSDIQYKRAEEIFPNSNPVEMFKPIVKQVLVAHWKYAVFSLSGFLRFWPIYRIDMTPPVNSIT